MSESLEEREKRLREEEANKIAKDRLEVERQRAEIERRRAQAEAYDRNRRYKQEKKAARASGGSRRSGSGFWGFLFKLIVFMAIIVGGYLFYKTHFGK